MNADISKLKTANIRPLVLMQDGWSNLHNDPILASSLSTGKETYLLKAKDCATDKKTAEYSSEEAIKDMKDIKYKLDIDVFGLCTDNEAKMKRMREIVISHADYKNVLVYGCQAHYFNLVEQDGTAEAKGLMKHIVEIQKFFRNHQRVAKFLQEKGGRKPQIPNDTRWNSQCDCLNTFVSNYEFYREIVREHEHENDIIPNNISNKIKSASLIQNAKDLKQQLTVVGTALNKLQSECTSFAEAINVWQECLENPHLGTYKNAIDKRYNEATTSFQHLAYLTDLRFTTIRRKNLNDEEKAIQWLQNRNSDWVKYYFAFSIQDEQYYPSTMFSSPYITSTPGHKWWATMATRTSIEDFKIFCQFMAKLHACPASSAGIERIFSTFGHIWSKLRNNLGVDKVYKLVKIYRFINMHNFIKKIM